MNYEYLVRPAPKRAKKNKAARNPAEKLALALTDIMNEMAEDGWEFVRSETLTVIEKSGVLSKASEYLESVLVFRRPKEGITASANVKMMERETNAREPSLSSQTSKPDSADKMAEAIERANNKTKANEAAPAETSGPKLGPAKR